MFTPGPGDLPPVTAHWTPGQRATLAALADTIVPPDDYPGGFDAGVLEYLDRLFAGDMSEQRQRYRSCLDSLDAESRAAYGLPFAELGSGGRADLLTAMESGGMRTRWSSAPSDFVADVVERVMEGYYGDPEGGGNRDAVSWRMIGFQVSD